jgi:protease-4
MSNNNPPPRRGPFGCFLIAILIASVFFNLILCGVIFLPDPNREDAPIDEIHLYGKKTESNKIAVVKAEGPLVEGLDAHILKQIETAGKDDNVKAIVVRIDSPGGTIGASEEIHRELTRLREGKHPRYPDWKAKPVVASMGSIAASGGYYIAMPAEKVFAEKGTLTGSIGVYAALPNAAKLANDNGVKLELIKAGDIKGSGSMLHTMTPQERQPWQDMVDQAYDQFLDVVVKGRPKLTKEQMRNEKVMAKKANEYDEKGNVVKNEMGQPKQIDVSRYRADGGSFTAAEAKQLGLIDDFGLLEDAVTAAAASANVSEYRVVTFKRPPTLLGALFGIKSQPGNVPDLQHLANGLTPRIWYMAPGSELSGIIAASGGK